MMMDDHNKINWWYNDTYLIYIYVYISSSIRCFQDPFIDVNDKVEKSLSCDEFAKGEHNFGWLHPPKKKTKQVCCKGRPYFTPLFLGSKNVTWCPGGVGFHPSHWPFHQGEEAERLLGSSQYFRNLPLCLGVSKNPHGAPPWTLTKRKERKIRIKINSEFEI